MFEMSKEDKKHLQIGADVYAKAMEVAVGLRNKIELGSFVESYMAARSRTKVVEEFLETIKALPEYTKIPQEPMGYTLLSRAKIVEEVEKIAVQNTRTNTMSKVFDPHKQCCFCGSNNEKGTVGYAGERQCPVCNFGGDGEPDTPCMFYKLIQLEQNGSCQ